MKTKKRGAVFLLPFLLLLAVLALRIFFAAQAEEISLKVFDTFQKIRPRIYQETPVRILDIDDESLAQFGQWPWPRTRIAEMTQELQKLGASVIVFDIVFAEEDRTSPSHVIPLWPAWPEIEALKSKIQELPDHDQVFAKSLLETTAVTGFSLGQKQNSSLPVLKAGVAYSGENPVFFLPHFRGVVKNIPLIENAAKGNGGFNFMAEHDGIIRRVPLIFRLGEKFYPSLVAETLRVAQKASTLMVKSSGGSGEISFGEKTGIVSIKIGKQIIPTDAQGRIWLYDTPNVPGRFIPAWKILSHKMTADEITGKIIFIGTSAAGLKDLRATPLDPVRAGTEVHAELLEQILLQNFLERPDWAAGAEILYLFFVGLLLILLLPRARAAWCAFFAMASLFFIFGFSWYCFAQLHLLIDPVVPSIASLIIYLAVSLINFLRTEQDKRHIRSAFSRYLAPGLVERLANHPDELKLGGESKNMSVLFADIHGFTAISEQYTAQELTHFMNRFLTPMTDIILKHNGTIDKYIGDCIMAFWNAPFDDTDHGLHACQAALKMQAYLTEWNETLRKEAEAHKKIFTPIKLGIGINTGDCCVGNMGSDQRFDYSVLGDEVNLASRLEGQARAYGVDIVIGQNTYDHARKYAALELDLIKVKGKNKPAQVFALLGDEKTRSSRFEELLICHEKMLKAYRAQNWAEAEKFIGECLKINFSGLEKFYSLYQERIKNYKTNSPGSNWDGIFTAINK